MYYALGVFFTEGFRHGGRNVLRQDAEIGADNLAVVSG